MEGCVLEITGKQRAASNPWTADEEGKFLEALALHGRDWKACSEYLESRDPRFKEGDEAAYSVVIA